MAAVAIPAPAAAQEDRYLIEIDGPTTMIPGEKAVLTVNVTGGPEGLVRYNATVTYGGAVSPRTGTTSSGSFNVTVTAPSSTGTFTVTFDVRSENGSVSNTARYDIRVVEAVVLSVELTNAANVTATGVPVQFFVDGELVGTVTANIPAASTRTVQYNWSAGGLSGGQHTLKVVVDPEQQFVRFADGSNVFESTFYVGDGGWGLANILLAIVLVIFMVVVFLTYMNRGKKKKRRPRA
ncbi:hypothetical protein AOA80_09535 [Methanomassiliicoccales archaeon RumEn M1]|nr:hypothetical protein AOA80_09535 [Methanomassiliicoccales archaeon RumEn M1]